MKGETSPDPRVEVTEKEEKGVEKEGE